MSGRLTCPIVDVAPLLPHSGNMVLLDEILDYDDESLQGRATIREDHVFLRPEGVVPAWMAMEILAQGIAAFDGCHAAQAGRGPAALGSGPAGREQQVEQGAEAVDVGAPANGPDRSAARAWSDMGVRGRGAWATTFGPPACSNSIAIASSIGPPL